MEPRSRLRFIDAPVLTVGETMALIDPLDDGPYEYGTRLQLRIAGAESNFAIALSRLGIGVSWISCVGCDPFGDMILTALKSEGVDISRVRCDPEAPTGVFFKWRQRGRSFNAYYRRGSGATGLSVKDVPDDALEGVNLVHQSGITTALSDRCRELVPELAFRAHRRGQLTTFDLNYRPRLWTRPGLAGEAACEVLANTDWCLCGLDEGNLIFDTSSPDELFDVLRAAGARNVVIRLGAEGAFVSVGDSLEKVKPSPLVDVVDEIGAGDAFAAGFVYGLLNGWAPQSSVRAGNLIAATALRGTGDWETVARLSEIQEDLIACQVS